MSPVKGTETDLGENVMRAVPIQTLQSPAASNDHHLGSWVLIIKLTWSLEVSL